MMALREVDLGEITERATRAIQENVDGGHLSEMSQIVGGSSSLTYKATLAVGGEHTKVVIKVAPPGLTPTRNRDVLRQARLLTLLTESSAVKVPTVLGVDEGSPVEIPPLFVMSFVEGESFEPQISVDVTSAAPDQIEARSLGAIDMLADLHEVSLYDARFAHEPSLTLEEEVSRWSAAFASVDESLRVGADHVEELLMGAVPDSTKNSVVHGDWRLGNMQCVGSLVNAVIDWELWSLSDTRIDLAWFLLFATPGHPHGVRHESFLPTPAVLRERYETATGGGVHDLEWFDALARYKQAAGCALVVKNSRITQVPGVEIELLRSSIPKLLTSARAAIA
jgi:aminoglycoside phosphotransferase (APT) family kinase protein